MKKENLKKLVYIGLSAAILSVVAPFSIPLGGIPITFCTLLIYIYCNIYKPKITIPSVLLYITVGAVGLPVFSSFRGGIAHILSPSGGFIIGYIPLACIISLLLSRRSNIIYKFAVMLVSTFVLYLCGILWYSFFTADFDMRTVVVFVAYFIPVDIIKIIIALILSRKIKNVIKL